MSNFNDKQQMSIWQKMKKTVITFLIGYAFGVLTFFCFHGSINAASKGFLGKFFEGLGIGIGNNECVINNGIWFTIANLALLAAFVYFRILKKEIPSCILKSPTLVGMMGTLFSLINSDLTNPQQLASNFSIAIVSTFWGIIVYLIMIFSMKEESDSSSDTQGE